MPEILARLGRGNNLVLQAEPGAGKTTVVPRALLEGGVDENGEIVVTQPRRLAARMAAARVAWLLSEPVGARCGFQVRFESAISKATRIRFVTEGILLRRLRAEPSLPGVGTVVLDEFHERHLETDVLLALLRRLQRTSRPDLRIVVMSATLDADPVAAYLDGSILTCPGRAFPVTIEHAERTSDRPIPHQVAAALRDVVAQQLDGHALVFLPGLREIRETAEACRVVAEGAGLELLALHGELSSAEQDRVAGPSAGRRVILATNIAETSVTLDGVTVVIDSGWVRRPAHNPWTGIPTLTLSKVSQASATQRAGRAGRTRAGRCVRLYTSQDFTRRPAFDPPEILRLDLAATVLDLHACEVAQPDAIAWLEAPPRAALDAAAELLRRLGAIEPESGLTAMGHAMLPIPAHPRIARLLLEGHARRVGHLAARLGALLSERPSHRDAGTDLWKDLQAVERSASSTVERATKQLGRHIDLSAYPRARLDADSEAELAQAILTAFPDRVGRRRGQTDVIVFADGGSGTLAAPGPIPEDGWVVAVASEERREGTRGARVTVRSAVAIESDWLLELCSEAVQEVVEVRFDATSERVEASEELRIGALTLERRILGTLPATAANVLFEAARNRGWMAFVTDPEALAQVQARCTFCRRFDESLPSLSQAEIEAALAELCEGRRSFSELRAADLLGYVRGRLPAHVHRALETWAPTHVELAGGRRLKVNYETDRDPWAESLLQDFFGAAKGPWVAAGRVPLVLHLLAPNRRAVQVTTDLEGFWARHYQDLRRALMRRYPKHAWPEDPLSATPPAPRPRR